MRLFINLFLILLTSTSLADAKYSFSIDTIKRNLAIENNIFIVQDDTVNAYTNGKYIAVHSGLLDLKEANYQSVATIILHEMGHIVNYHIWKIQVANHIAITNIKASCNSDDIAANIICSDKYIKELMTYLRSLEEEADDYAFNEAKKQDYNSETACSIFKWMSEHDTITDVSMIDHPLSKDRYNKCITILSQ